MEKIRALGNKPAAEAEGGTGAPSRPVMQAPFQASFALNTTTAKQMLAGPVRPMSPYRPPKLTGFRDEHPYAPRGVAACCLRGYLRGSRHSRSMFSAFRADPVNCNCALRLQLCGMHCSFPLLLSSVLPLPFRACSRPPFVAGDCTTSTMSVADVVPTAIGRRGDHSGTHYGSTRVWRSSSTRASTEAQRRVGSHETAGFEAEGAQVRTRSRIHELDCCDS